MSTRPHTGSDQKPWYKHPHLWLVICLPIISVVVSLSFARTAFLNKADIVRDDWYMDGKALEQDLSRDTAAAAANLRAQISISPQGQVDAILSHNPNTAVPPQLDLYFFHPIKAKKDHKIILKRREDGHYQGQLDAELLKPSNYHVELDGYLWRLSSRVDLPIASFELLPLATVSAELAAKDSKLN